MGEKTKTNKNVLNWFKDQWQDNQLFSIAVILILMLILQTFALNYSRCNSFGEGLGIWFTNITNVLRNNSGIGIIALGMTFVIISGGIDLAVGSTLVAVGAVVMMLIDTGIAGPLSAKGITGAPAFLIAIVVGIIVGVLLGEVTGVLVSRALIPPFIVTLGTLKIFRSVTQHFTQNSSPRVPLEFTQIANGKIGNIMVLPIIYWIIFAVVLHIVATRTVFGRQVFSIGSNEKAAKLSGINVERVKRRVYVLMGFLCSVASIITVSRIGSMDYANAGSGYELDAIAAVVVGGTSFAGGKGSIPGTMMGVVTIAIMNNLLNLWGVPPFLREAFKGLIIIIAVLLQRKERI